MNKAIVFLLLLGFLAVAVFGFVAMSHAMGSAHSGCIGAASAGAPCPLRDPFGYLAFHLEVFKGFSTAIMASLVFAVFVSVIVIAFVIVNTRDSDDERRRVSAIPFRVAFLSSHSLREVLRRYSFLALFEHSPATS